MKNLFKSQTSYDLLDLLIANPGKFFYLNELTKTLSKDPANLLRELAKLQNEGLVLLKNENDKKYYGLDEKSPIIPELKALFSKLQTSDFDRKFKTEWMLGEDIPNICPFFSKIWLDCFVKEFAKVGGKAYKKISAIFRDYHLWFYYDEKDANEVGEHLVNKMEADPKFMDLINENIVRTSDELRDYVSKLPEDRLDKLSNEKLWGLYRKHEDIHNAYYQWGWIPVAADMFCNNLTERGKKMLRDLGVPEDKINEYLTTLNQPTNPSLMKIEQDEIAKIGIKVQKDPKQFALFKSLFKKFKEEEVKLYGLYEHHAQYEERFEKYLQNLVDSIRPDIKNDLQNHYTKYFYNKFLFTEEQGIYNFEFYLKALVRLVNSDPDIQKTLIKDKAETAKLLFKRDELIKQLKLNSNQKRFFIAWGEFMVTKIYRRYAQIYAIYRMVPIIEEIGNRLGLSIKQTKFMTTEEIYKALFEGVYDAEEIKKRVAFSVYYADANEHTFYTGEQAQKALELIQKETISQVTEIHGQCGCQGVARGIVKIVDVVADMEKVNPGDILVSISTQPDLVPAMKKASGFVTNQGGVTSHAAIVAREMNKPCVIGTKIATKVLKDGMEVEVDATKGVVRILK
ncbi:MAG: winged helix-turn-helix domain-containing protein [Patescibacteria group bacterium]